MIAGYPVVLRNQEIFYLTPEDDVGEDEPRPVGYDILEDLILRHHPWMRRVLMPMGRQRRVFYNFLHWTDDTDLQVLDTLARTAQLTAEHLATGLLVEVGSITCLKCKAQLRTAQHDGGQVLVTTELIRNHDFERKCPVCKEDIGLNVPEFLDDFLNESVPKEGHSFP